MWPFKKRQWVVVETDVQPCLLEIMAKAGMTKIHNYGDDLTRRVALVHYRDELSKNEKVEKIVL